MAANTAVFGIYKSSAQAESAVDQIVEFRTVAGGFTHNDISVLLHDTKSSNEFAHEKNTKPPEKISTVTIGGGIGGTLGLLTGIGTLAIPDLGTFIAAGPIMAGLTGSMVGGLVSALLDMGIPEYEAKRYTGRVQDGAVLLSVHCETSDQITRAKDLLKQTGAEDISSASEKAVSLPGLNY